jgi:hypothetical protein
MIIDRPTAFANTSDLGKHRQYFFGFSRKWIGRGMLVAIAKMGRCLVLLALIKDGWDCHDPLGDRVNANLSGVRPAHQCLCG